MKFLPTFFPAAALVLDRVLKHLAPERVVFSALGLREGWLYSQLSDNERYLDPLVDAGLGQEPRQRVFIPLGTDPAVPARLRGEGWITITALSVGDDGAALGCSHRLQNGEPLPY